MDIVIGWIFLAIGVTLVWWTIKYPNKKKPDPIGGNFKGYLGGILGIVMGILLIAGYVKWK